MGITVIPIFHTLQRYNLQQKNRISKINILFNILASKKVRR